MVADWNFDIRPKMQVMSNEEVEYLYNRALDIIENTGVRFLHPEALKLLQESGAVVSDNSIIKIQASLVEHAIRSVPKRLVIYDREGNPAMELGGGNTGGRNTYYGTGSDLLHMYDPFTGELRLTLARDIGDMAKVVDALPDMDFVMSYGIPSDSELEKVFQTEFVQMVENTSKPIVFTSDNGHVSQQIIDIAALVAGGSSALKEKPFILNYSQPTSPLQHSHDALGKMFACAQAEIPVVYPPGMIPGATAPCTMAGTIIQSLAEGLTALTVHQLKRKGAPIVLCGAHGCMDMKSSINVYAAPERLMTEAALCAVYQYFKIPTWGFGGCTDAITLDEQAGMEFGMMSLWASLCGVNLAHDVGYLGSGMIGDLRAIVLNNEINGYVRHLVRNGVGVDKEKLAIEAIERVGAGGSFLMDKHTMDHFRTALWYPSLTNRDNLNKWQDMGEKPMKAVLGERVKEILNKHEPKPLKKEIKDELEKVLI